MYYYIIDPQNLSQRQFERVQSQLYSCLSESHINGETFRVTSLRSVNQLVESSLERGAKTIIAVGSDETMHDVINSARGHDITLGYIPLVKSEVADILGIADIESAARIIANRRIAILDLGLVNGFAFLTKISFGLAEAKTGWASLAAIRDLFATPSFELKFSSTGSFSAASKVIGGTIVNGTHSEHSSNITNPTDGLLDVILLPSLSKYQIVKHRKDILEGSYEKVPGSSLVHSEKIEILSPEGLPLRVGNRVVAKTPATIEVVSKALRMIVGKARVF
jgi:diacylglycerol kinase family enzyme